MSSVHTFWYCCPEALVTIDIMYSFIPSYVAQQLQTLVLSLHFPSSCFQFLHVIMFRVAACMPLNHLFSLPNSIKHTSAFVYSDFIHTYLNPNDFSVLL